MMTDIMPEAAFDSTTSQTPPTKYVPIIVVVLIVLVATIGIIATQRKPVQDVMIAPTTSPAAVIPTSDLITVNMDAGSYYFTPSEIRVKKGQTVRIVLTSKDMEHNFTLDEFGVIGPVTKAGETTALEFVADKAGQFQYYCAIMDHRAKGQVGTLIVEE